MKQQNGQGEHLQKTHEKQQKQPSKQAFVHQKALKQQNGQGETPKKHTKILKNSLQVKEKSFKSNKKQSQTHTQEAAMKILKRNRKKTRRQKCKNARKTHKKE